MSRLHPCLLSLASPWSFAQELGRARSPSSPILSRPLSPPRAAGISPRCPRKGGGSHMALSHPAFPGNWAEESLLWSGGALRLCLSPQGVTHQQWYLFNDFLIEPVDKVSTEVTPWPPRAATQVAPDRSLFRCSARPCSLT